MQKEMQKVAILDLRGNDAWDYDWILVVRSYEFSLVTQEIAYIDKNGDFIIFDGTEDEAYQFFSNYCKDNNLRLIGYDTMEENDIAENELAKAKCEKDSFIKWIREVINSQASAGGNSVCLDDFSRDGMTEYSYPKTFIVNGDKYSWNISVSHTKRRHLTTHYELWFHGKAFNESKKIATGNVTLNKVRKGLKEIYEYYKKG